MVAFGRLAEPIGDAGTVILWAIGVTLAFAGLPLLALMAEIRGERSIRRSRSTENRGLERHLEAFAEAAATNDFDSAEAAARRALEADVGAGRPRSRPH